MKQAIAAACAAIGLGGCFQVHLGASDRAGDMHTVLSQLAVDEIRDGAAFTPELSYGHVEIDPVGNYLLALKLDGCLAQSDWEAAVARSPVMPLTSTRTQILWDRLTEINEDAMLLYSISENDPGSSFRLSGATLMLQLPQQADPIMVMMAVGHLDSGNQRYVLVDGLPFSTATAADAAAEQMAAARDNPLYLSAISHIENCFTQIQRAELSRRPPQHAQIQPPVPAEQQFG